MSPISESSLHAILGDFTGASAVGQALGARVAIAATVKVQQVQRAMGEQLVALLDPSLGSRFDRRV